ncbi:hypothetical protein RclHR1_09220009 [Rhizophagus clarus]|uniref:BTB domain-containing protein n=1 Tax=Rhizophagus clarus TaxID=94130 RepID=A0A2Z6S9T7_9GLOM|nr:hypothetical protein RclHR1_09220009 [Rhizophagus clarus]GES77288.1 hypothetical protein GLOIN_2v1882676 [Rhizophagus clarus]
MSIQFFPKLSQNLTELLKDDKYHDITIEIGVDPNIKIFRAHKGILCYRSPYLRRYLASNKNNNDNNDLTHIKLPNILPDIFQIILEYIYGGIISLNGNDTSDILKVLVAADVFNLNEVVDYLQKYLIQNKTQWMEQHFELTYRTSFQSNNFSELQQHCVDFMAKSPEKVFKSLDFTSLTERSLISLIERDDLQMKEIDVWEYVTKWGLAQNQTLTPDPDTWTDDDFKMMENTLQNCLPLIRFFSLSSKEFLHEVRPYKKLFKPQFYEKILNSYMDPDSKPSASDNVLLPRSLKINGIIDTEIVNLNIISIVSRWIDKVDINSKFAHLRELYLPYKFDLLLRGSYNTNGFSPKRFHELCDGKPNTVTFIKVKGTEEILGGYNPSIWKSSGEWNQSCSFIFSFKNKNKLDEVILSRVRNMDKALYYSDVHGPSFGSDLRISIYSRPNRSYVFNYNSCKHINYEKKIRDTEDFFSIEEYEVFQIKRSYNEIEED